MAEHDLDENERLVASTLSLNAELAHTQRELARFQGRSHVWYCGAWTRYGFHEDGLMSGLAVVQGLREQWKLRDDAARAA